MRKIFTLFMFSGFIGSSAWSQSNQPPPPAVYINLLDPAKAVMDGVGAIYGVQYSDYVDNVDAQKLWNTEIENIALMRHDTALAIEFRHIPKLTDTLFLRLYLRQHPYSLQVFSANFPAGVPVRSWIVDKYLNTKTELNIHDTSLYSFTPGADTNSYRNRFMLVFNRQIQATAVPVTNTINRQHSLETGKAATVTDKESSINIYPNPADNYKALLQFNNMSKGTYEAAIYNANGQKMAVYIFAHTEADKLHPLTLDPSWPTGIYTINVSCRNTKNTMNLKLFITRK